MLNKQQIISIKIRLEQLKTGDYVYPNDSAFDCGQVYDSICVCGKDRVPHEILPDEGYRFVLKKREPAENRGGAPGYNFQQFNKKHTCYMRVRADQIAGLIEEDSEETNDI
jgi:hypothetical protein